MLSHQMSSERSNDRRILSLFSFINQGKKRKKRSRIKMVHAQTHTVFSFSFFPFFLLLKQRDTKPIDNQTRRGRSNGVNERYENLSSTSCSNLYSGLARSANVFGGEVVRLGKIFKIGRGGDHWNLMESRRKIVKCQVFLSILLWKIKNFPLLGESPRSRQPCLYLFIYLHFSVTKDKKCFRRRVSSASSLRSTADTDPDSFFTRQHSQFTQSNRHLERYTVRT